MPDLVPLWAVVSLVNEFLQDSPSNTRGIQPYILSNSFEVHDLEFTGRVAMVGLLCGDG